MARSLERLHQNRGLAEKFLGKFFSVRDGDLYLDIAHFTERVAGLMFRALPPILAERERLRCLVR